MSKETKKGFAFERDTAYSLLQGGHDVERTGDNTAGVDLVSIEDTDIFYYIECKFHKTFTWNELVKIFNKTEQYCETFEEKEPVVIYKTNLQPVLVMHRNNRFKLTINTFNDFFGFEWKKRPKGYKLWNKK